MLCSMDALTNAIAAAGGVARLAQNLGIAQNVVSNWKARGQAPASRCVAIEEATGISRHELRPDVFGQEPARRTRKRGG